MAEEFADVDFNEERLEKRFRKTIETLSKDPRKSIYGSSANRAEAKAIYCLSYSDIRLTAPIILFYAKNYRRENCSICIRQNTITCSVTTSLIRNVSSMVISGKYR
jgi:hypothetical protein